MLRKRHLVPTMSVGFCLAALAVRAVTIRDRGSLAMHAAPLIIKARAKPLANVDAFRSDIMQRTSPDAAAIPPAMCKAFNVRKGIDGHKVIIIATAFMNA